MEPVLMERCLAWNIRKARLEKGRVDGREARRTEAIGPIHNGTPGRTNS